MKKEIFESLGEFYTDFRTSGMFLLTGLIGVIVDNGVLLLTHSFLGLPLAISKAASTETAIISNFLINDNWTFNQGERPGTKLERLLKSNGIRLIGLVISVAVLVFLHEKIGIPLLIANMISIGVGFVFNYTLESFAWKMHEK